MNFTSILRFYIYVRLFYCYCTHLRDVKKIVNDHLNIKVYQYIFLVFFLLSFIYFLFSSYLVLYISFISQHVISISLYSISKGSCNPIVFETSKVICVVISTYCKFSFLRISVYSISLLLYFMLIILMIILID